MRVGAGVKVGVKVGVRVRRSAVLTMGILTMAVRTMAAHWRKQCCTCYGCTYYGGALDEEVLSRVHDLLGAEPLGKEDEDDRLVRGRG